MRFAHGRYRGTSMSVCMIVGQDRQSRLTAGTKMEITKILRMLFEEKGVTYFCVMGNNDFERDCYYEMKQTGYMVLQDKTLGSFVFNKPTKFEIEMLGEWAFCENNKLIPDEAIEKATEKMIEISDYIIVGSKFSSDLVSAAETGRLLGKSIFRVFA